MNFTPDMLTLVLNGTKTQTRRLADRFEDYNRLTQLNGKLSVVQRRWLGLAITASAAGYGDVYDDFSEWRLKWQVGRTYTVAPGRGKAGVARMRLLDIRKEPAIDISEEDARAEGFDSREAFWDKLRSLYGADVDLTEPYYALTFELVTP